MGKRLCTNSRISVGHRSSHKPSDAAAGSATSGAVPRRVPRIPETPRRSRDYETREKKDIDARTATNLFAEVDGTCRHGDSGEKADRLVDASGRIRRTGESTSVVRNRSSARAHVVLPPGTRCHNVLPAKPHAGFPPIFTWRTADCTQRLHVIRAQFGASFKNREEDEGEERRERGRERVISHGTRNVNFFFSSNLFK